MRIVPLLLAASLLTACEPMAPFGDREDADFGEVDTMQAAPAAIVSGVLDKTTEKRVLDSIASFKESLQSEEVRFEAQALGEEPKVKEFMPPEMKEFRRVPCVVKNSDLQERQAPPKQ